jgi:cell division protein FtsI/penicillin-binding protein 2
VFSSRRKLQRLEVELENLLEEIKDIEQLTLRSSSSTNSSLLSRKEKVESRAGLKPAEDLKSRRKRAEQLKKDIAREKERLALFESERAWVPGDTRNMAIGQGNVLVSPLQMARAVAAIANGGKLLRPHLVLQSSSSTNSSLLSGKEKVESRAGLKPECILPVSRGTLATVRSAMRRVVFGRQGTARQKELRKHDVAAKTGTAELGGT